MILGVIFDFDNTLYDYEKLNKLSLNKLFESVSIDYNIDKILIENMYKKINVYIKNSNNPVNKFNKSIYVKKLVEKLNLPLIDIERYINIYLEEFNKNYELYENVLDLFKLLKKNKIKIGILSNNNFMQQYEKLKLSELLDYIDVIQTSDECGEEKPNMEMYLQVINKLNVKEENLVYVGDNYEHDIIPSLELKMLPFYFKKDVVWKLHDKYIEFGNFGDLNVFFENYFKTVDELIFLSKYFGQSILNIQGPGGNISVKLDDIIFIKSSGAVLGNLSYNEGYCLADNNKCLELLESSKELELKDSKLFGYKIPSMETFFHSFMKKYTVHVHFTLSNILFCSNKNFNLIDFPYSYERIGYIPPGLLLAQEIYKKYSKDKDIYFLDNHGIIITGDSVNNIITIYENIYNYFNELLGNKFNEELNTFYINKEYYIKKNRSIIVRYLDYSYEILEKIKYSFPDLAIFVERIGIFNNLSEFYEKMGDYNIIIINKKIYICAENINKIYYIIELLDKYKILCEYSYEYLNRIDDIKYLQNMEAEKFRKL